MTKSHPKLTNLVNVKIDTANLRLHLEFPFKWLTILIAAVLIYLSPSVWDALQTAVVAIR
jgi:hypothetical protein